MLRLPLLLALLASLPAQAGWVLEGVEFADCELPAAIGGGHCAPGAPFDASRFLTAAKCEDGICWNRLRWLGPGQFEVAFKLRIGRDGRYYNYEYLDTLEVVYKIPGLTWAEPSTLVVENQANREFLIDRAVLDRRCTLVLDGHSDGWTELPKNWTNEIREAILTFRNTDPRCDI